MNRSITLAEAVNRVRKEIMDKPEYNRLLGYKHEFEDGEIITAIESGLDFINYTGQPIMCFTVNSISGWVWHILEDAAVVKLMDMMIILKARNTINVNDGGAMINREGNIDFYRAIKHEREERATIKLSEYKAYVNRGM